MAALFFIVASMMVNKAGATNYYVSSKGNDAADGLTPIFIRNNIFYESDDFCLYSQQENNGSNTDAIWAAFILDNNSYYKSSKEKPVIRWRGGAANGGGDYFMEDVNQYQTKSGKELHTLFADPMLTSEYTLKSDSPAIDADIDVGYPYNGAAPDMGAFEFITGSKKQRGNRK